MSIKLFNFPALRRRDRAGQFHNQSPLTVHTDRRSSMVTKLTSHSRAAGGDSRGPHRACAGWEDGEGEEGGGKRWSTSLDTFNFGTKKCVLNVLSTHLSTLQTH